MPKKAQRKFYILLKNIMPSFIVVLCSYEGSCNLQIILALDDFLLKSYTLRCPLSSLDLDYMDYNQGYSEASVPLLYFSVRCVFSESQCFRPTGHTSFLNFGFNRRVTR